ncbi:MAG TPA: DUF3891 family protein [Gaiellales bacterium]|nr:DUF3891 family protein [Gaiellales bacterium]
MILRPDPRGTLAIGQPAHAWLSGRLADAWRWRFEPLDAVRLAALQHDIGMAGWDAAPVLDPRSGLPYSFTSMPRAMHVELWSRAARLMVAQSGYAALLVSMHGTGLYERYVSEQERAAEPVRGYLAAEYVFQERLRESLGADAADVARNAALLRCWDWLSLFLCTGADQQAAFTAVPTDCEPADLDLRWSDDARTQAALAPWPFTDPALGLQVEARLLDGTYPDQTSLDAALAVAPREVLTLVLRPGPAGQASPPQR